MTPGYEWVEGELPASGSWACSCRVAERGLTDALLFPVCETRIDSFDEIVAGAGVDGSPNSVKAGAPTPMT